jgi:Pilin (bacterial filament)
MYGEVTDGGFAMKPCISVSSLALLLATAAAAAAEKPSAADVQLHHTAINKALTTAAPFKTAVESYRRHHDDFPASNLDAGLQQPDTYKNPDVRQIAVDQGGTINIMLTASSGVDGGIIVLTPNLPKNSDDFAVEWKGTTANYTDASDATLGLCEYTKVP